MYPIKKGASRNTCYFFQKIYSVRFIFFPLHSYALYHVASPNKIPIKYIKVSDCGRMGKKFKGNKYLWDALYVL